MDAYKWLTGREAKPIIVPTEPAIRPKSLVVDPSGFNNGLPDFRWEQCNVRWDDCNNCGSGGGCRSEGVVLALVYKVAEV